MEPSPATSYDDVPYTSYPYVRTSPDRLCTLARLFGVAAVAPAEARVLELGCASGGNLLPLADRSPGGRFVGVDLSARQIEAGRDLAAEAGLANVELRHASILDVDASWGQFDYVVCHGVYSWVPPDVQRHILAICRDALSPAGVAYISYNTYPGWHMREMVRHMMRYHVRGIPDAKRQVAQARALVDFLAKAVEPQPGPYALLLQRELAVLSRMGDDYLYHEHLEDQNQPVYFHEFVERLESHELQYLCESDVHMMLTREFVPEVRDTLDRIAPDLVRMEQYGDFVRNRQFRASLVCRRELSLRRALGPEAIMGCRIGFPGRSDGTPVDLAPGVVQEFENAEGLKIGSSQSVTKAALLLMRREWPADLAFEELASRAIGLAREAGIDLADDERSRVALAADLLECLVSGAGIELRTEAPAFVGVASERPRAAPTSRAQARRHAFATNARHQRVDLDTLAAAVVPVCDGAHDRAGMLEHLVGLAVADKLTVERGDDRVRDPDVLREGLRPVLERTLERLAQHALLEA
ncbi:MAG TPA: class I SAM-dependent methyltransferase [Nannocystaceae bacterium]|nr:class I SAM-dependent methyltransferase [Nannocystaceae bacterium]